MKLVPLSDAPETCPACSAPAGTSLRCHLCSTVALPPYLRMDGDQWSLVQRLAVLVRRRADAS